MAIKSGAGGFVTLTKSATAQLDSPYDTPEWKTGQAYEADELVYTEATASGTDITFWRAKEDHTSTGTAGTVGGDVATAATAGEAEQLVSDKWDKLEMGTLYSLQSWAYTQPVDTSARRLLIETQPRTSNAAGAPTLALTYLDNIEGQNMQRALGAVNTRVYVTLYPKGLPATTGAKYGRIQGFMRVGESGYTGEAENDLQRTVTLSGDGDITDTVVTVA